MIEEPKVSTVVTPKVEKIVEPVVDVPIVEPVVEPVVEPSVKSRDPQLDRATALLNKAKSLTEGSSVGKTVTTNPHLGDFF